MDTCSWSWDLGFAGSSLSLASPSSGPFTETQPIYLLAQDHLIYKPAAHKGMALFHKYTETVRDREEERMRMSSWHIPSLSEKWDILQESDPQSPTNPFQTVSPLTKSSLQTIASFLPSHHQQVKEGGPRRRDREREREGGIHLLHRSTLSGLCGCPVFSGHRDRVSWSSRSYNTADKKPRARPWGNLRGGAARAGKIQAATKQLRYITPELAHIPLRISVWTIQPEDEAFLLPVQMQSC